MNNQVIKLRANTNHFGHPVTSHDHPGPALRQPLTHTPEPMGDGGGESGGKTNQRQQKPADKTKQASASEKTLDNVSFHFKHPTAKKVLLAAEFTEWKKKAIAMTASEDGVWQASVKLAPGRYRYRFIVDGNWQDDPDARERVANPYGSCDCVAEVS